MACAPPNAPFPSSMGADPWAETKMKQQRKSQPSMVQSEQLDRKGARNLAETLARWVQFGLHFP